MKEPTQKLIALVDKLDQLPWMAETNYNEHSEIKIKIARLDMDHGKGTLSPRNWSLQYDEGKQSTGGCFCRLYASDKGTVYFQHYGPEILYGDANDYRHGFKAMELIQKRTSALRDKRGPSIDTADEMGRWLEACGIETVWLRPEGHKNRSSWLSEGDWRQLSIGQIICEVRRHFPVAPIAQVQEAVAL